MCFDLVDFCIQIQCMFLQQGKVDSDPDESERSTKVKDMVHDTSSNVSSAVESNDFGKCQLKVTSSQSAEQCQSFRVVKYSVCALWWSGRFQKQVRKLKYQGLHIVMSIDWTSPFRVFISPETLCDGDNFTKVVWVMQKVCGTKCFHSLRWAVVALVFFCASMSRLTYNMDHFFLVCLAVCLQVCHADVLACINSQYVCLGTPL